jgi:chemotaxis protein MotB
MRTSTLITILGISAAFLFAGGCVSEAKYRDLQTQNRTQQERIAALEAEANTARLQLDQLKARLAEAESRGGTDIDALRQQVAALEKDIAQKQLLITQLQGQLMRGGQALPAELNTMLEDFAKGSDMITYDPQSGVVKFKSDLLFTPGSADVDPKAREAIKALVGILNSEQGKQFDAVIAGHTDDMLIQKPSTKAAHPTNWYLSAHRAISVLNLMIEDGMDATRVSERGFGEFRPVAPNAPGKKGNAANRRVEIFIVTKGM